MVTLPSYLPLDSVTDSVTDLVYYMYICRTVELVGRLIYEEKRLLYMN